MALLFVTHPEVVIDPGTPVPRWRLSAHGIARMRAFAASRAAARVGEVWASTETKAIEAAGLLAARFGLPVRVHPGLGENDRRATGFLPPDEFEPLVDAFFANPLASVRGWEPAGAAQARVATTVAAILCEPRSHQGDVAVVAHGAVGALLLSQFLQRPISRDDDQPSQGHYWSFDPRTQQVLHGWRAIAPLARVASSRSRAGC